MNQQAQERKQFWVILGIVFFGFLGISIPYLIFPALFLNPTYSILPETWGDSSRAVFLGITLAAYPFGQFLGSPILGSLSDDYGRKPLLTCSLLITAFCNLITAFAIGWQHLGLLILSRFGAGLMEGNIAIARAMASELRTISKHKTFGNINAAASIAYLIGPLLGGIMTEDSLFRGFTTATPFYFICLLFILLSIVSVVVLENKLSVSRKEIRTFWQRINLFKRLKSLFANKRLEFLMISSTFFTLAVDIFYEFGPVYLTVKWLLDPSQLVLYNGILCITLAIGNGWLPTFISSRASKKQAIIWSMILFTIFLLAMVLTDSQIVMFLLFALSGLVIGLAVTLITVKISDSVSNAIQGEVMGVQISLRVLGDAFICLLGGILLLLSSKVILIVAGVLSLTAMIYFRIKIRKN